MPGEHGYDNEEKERKQRIKKMKAKTSKMRLAVIDKKKKKGFKNNADRMDYNKAQDELDYEST